MNENLEDRMKKLLEQQYMIDASEYFRAAIQAQRIEERLTTPGIEPKVIYITVDQEIFPLHITHAVVLNEVYCMLENLQNLSKIYAKPIEGADA